MNLLVMRILAACVLMWGLVSVEAQKAPAPQNQPLPASTVPPQQPPATKIDPAKEADIRKLLELVGSKALVTQMMDAMLNNIKPMLAGNLPPGEYQQKLIDLFFEKFRAKADPQQLIDLIVPIYDKHLSREEIKALIQFYETPLGKKTVSVLPAIALESREAGEKWGEALGRNTMSEVLAENPDLAKALEAASKRAP